jgi:hypothetical protein
MARGKKACDQTTTIPNISFDDFMYILHWMPKHNANYGNIVPRVQPYLCNVISKITIMQRKGIFRKGS